MTLHAQFLFLFDSLWLEGGRLMKKFSALIILTLVVVSISHGAVIRVPADYPTIQEALNAAESGDTVLVAPGVYHESLQWPTLENLTLEGEDPNDHSVVQPPSGSRCLTYAPSVTGSEMSISNFIFRDGFSNTSGGALRVLNSTVRIDNCKILSSYTVGRGGGMFFLTCNVEITDSVISGCHSELEGGGARFDSCNVSIVNTIVEDNNTGFEDFTSDGLGLYLMMCTGEIRNSIIRDHSNYSMNGAGILSTGGVDIIGCLFERNEQPAWNAISGALHTGGNCRIQDNIFIDNIGRGAGITTSGTDVYITNNLFIRNFGGHPTSSAIWVEGSPNISFCTFVDSKKTAITIEENSHPVINHCIFSGNERAILGLYTSSEATSDFNVFFNNLTDYDGIYPGPND